MEMFLRVSGAFLAVISFAILLEIPKRLIAYAGITGALGWMTYLIADNFFDSVVLVALVSSMVIAFLSHTFARVLKSPVSVFFVAGILPSVPGGSIYRSVYFMIYNRPAVSEFYFRETLQIASAIALAIFIADSVFRVINYHGEKRRRK